MKLLDVLTAPWAIEPSKLAEIHSIYATHLRGEKIDIAAVEARIGRPLANEPAPYQVVDGVAILECSGVMAKRANLFSQISGGASTQILMRDLQQAVDDKSAHSVIIVFDTPGGTVDGTQTFANAIRAAGRQKPVVSLADGTMASAGVWAGLASSKVYIADNTTGVGSIGVASQHVDTSGADKQAGLVRTDIFAGKYKRIASNTGPLSDDGRQTMQDQVDYIYSLFVQAVAEYRGVSVETVLDNMAEGRMFIGEQAIAAGLVDGVATLSELITQLNQDRASGSPISRAGAAQQASLPLPKGNNMLTAEQVAAENPDIAAHFRAEGHKAGLEAGASAERARIQSIEATLVPGHETLVTALKFDGKSTAGDAALAINAAERAARDAHATAMANEAPDPLKLKPAKTAVGKPADLGASGQMPTTQAAATTLDVAAKEYQANNPGVSYIAAVKAVQQGV